MHTFPKCWTWIFLPLDYWLKPLCVRFCGISKKKWWTKNPATEFHFKKIFASWWNKHGWCLISKHLIEIDDDLPYKYVKLDSTASEQLFPAKYLYNKECTDYLIHNTSYHISNDGKELVIFSHSLSLSFSFDWKWNWLYSTISRYDFFYSSICVCHAFNFSQTSS